MLLFEGRNNQRGVQKERFFSLHIQHEDKTVFRSRSACAIFGSHTSPYNLER